MNIIANGKVTGVKEMSRMLGKAPKVFVPHVRKGMIQEGRGFIGKSPKKIDRSKRTKTGAYKDDGVFRRQLARKTSAKGKSWDIRVARQFKYVLRSRDRLHGMNLKMGILGNRFFHKRIAMMQTGGVVKTRERMIIPVYRNLGRISGHYSLFRKMAREGKIVPVPYKNLVYYFRRDMSDDVGDDLLWYATNRITIPKRYDFHRAVRNRKPKMIRGIQRATDRAVKQIDKGRLNTNVKGWTK